MEENQNPEQKKLSYEELENVAKQISQQNQSLYAKLQEANKVINDLQDARMLNRLNFLFRVVEHNYLYPADFVTSCTQEIVETMTIPEEPAEEAKPEE